MLLRRVWAPLPYPKYYCVLVRMFFGCCCFFVVVCTCFGNQGTNSDGIPYETSTLYFEAGLISLTWGQPIRWGCLARESQRASCLTPWHCVSLYPVCLHGFWASNSSPVFAGQALLQAISVFLMLENWLVHYNVTCILLAFIYRPWCFWSGWQTLL